MPSLYNDPTAIKALIILGYSCMLLAVSSKPIRLNICSGCNDVSRIVSKLRAMRVSY